MTNLSCLVAQRSCHQYESNAEFSYVNLRANISKLRFTLSKVWTYAKFGFLPMITLFLMTINYRIDVIMLEKNPTVSLAQIGVYSVGVALAEKVWLIPDAIKDILLSKLCLNNKNGEEEVARVIRLNVVVSIFMVIIISLLSTPMIRLFYGAEYRGADIVTIIILCGTLGMVFYKMVYSYNIAHGKRVASLIFLAVAAALNVIGNALLIPIMGIYGAALTSVISYLVCGVCFIVYFHRISDVPYKKILILQKEDMLLMKKILYGKS